MSPDPILALAHHPLAVWLRNSLAYPVLETAHILGIATLFGSLLIVELSLLGIIRRMDVAALARAVLPWTLAGFALAALTGLCLFFARATELIANSAFSLKLLLIMIAGCNAAWLHSRGPLDATHWLTRVQAAASLLIWMAVIACGRWIAYA
ncbi:DUF6644 family protein [Viridibacterium curvum]|uniref:DUF6644 domain-containing protein n=1 Tax=Viridibacterium curvum TaxID=1101404 RepID=A0ABP9QUY6_9RHOO